MTKPLTKAERKKVRAMLDDHRIATDTHIRAAVPALLDAADALDELKAEVQRVIDGMPPEDIWQHLDTVKEQLRAALNPEAKK